MDNPEKLATRRRKTKQTHNKICVGHHYAQTNTYNVNKTTGGKDHHLTHRSFACVNDNNCPGHLERKQTLVNDVNLLVRCQ